MVTLQFPEGFLWGSATSAHQVEGNNINSDWWAWEHAGRVKDRSGLACDHYRRFAEDFDMAARLGHRAHRFSVEWSRVEPEPGRFDDEALMHYQEVVKALRARNLEPVVTLHHFTSPQWVAEKGGWVNTDVVEQFARYTERVVKALGNAVRYWITINEPMVFVHMHYMEGEGPPGLRSVKNGLRVMEHLVRAHAQSYRILHEALPSAQVSIAKHLPIFLPCRKRWIFDRLATSLTDRFFNMAFLEALTEGRWSVPGLGCRRIPEAASTLDYLGVNFYRRHFIRSGISPARWCGRSCDLAHHTREVEELTTWMGWEVHPESFLTTLKRFGSLGLPIFVTENGTCMADDTRRWSYIVRHIAAMHRALDQGTQVLGYLYWSLLDNFEWAHGFAPRFGLIEVDYPTQNRQVRDSARKFAGICRANQLTLKE